MLGRAIHIELRERENKLWNACNFKGVDVVRVARGAGGFGIYLVEKSVVRGGGFNFEVVGGNGAHAGGFSV